MRASIWMAVYRSLWITRVLGVQTAWEISPSPPIFLLKSLSLSYSSRSKRMGFDRIPIKSNKWINLTFSFVSMEPNFEYLPPFFFSIFIELLSRHDLWTTTSGVKFAVRNVTCLCAGWVVGWWRGEWGRKRDRQKWEGGRKGDNKVIKKSEWVAHLGPSMSVHIHARLFQQTAMYLDFFRLIY